MEVKREYYKNGNLKSEYEIDDSGNLNGIYKNYNENGIFRNKVMFKDGFQLDGEVISYDYNGKKYRSSNLINGKFNGLIQEWWPNGNIKYKLNFLDDSPVGILNEWDYFGNQITNQDINDFVSHGIDSKNKINYRIYNNRFNPADIFSDFIDDLKDDCNIELSAQFMMVKEFPIEKLLNEFLIDFVSKHGFVKNEESNLELWKKEEYEIVKMNNNFILSSLRYFDSRIISWGVNEYCKKYINVNWIQGIGLIYSYDEFKDNKEYQSEIAYHIPYYGLLPDGGESISIYCQSNYIAEYFADQVILNNGGFHSFRTLQHLDLWKNTEYAYAGPLFLIFINGTEVIINRIESSMKRLDGKRSLTGISEFSDIINNDIKGLKRLIYNEGDGMVQDGRFWISESKSIINSWWNDDEKAAYKFKEIVKEIDEKHPVLEISIKEVIKKAKSSDFLSNMEFLDIYTSDYMIGLAMGDNFMHITIMIKKELMSI